MASAIQLIARMEAGSEMESSCSVTLQNAAGWKAGDGALSSSPMDNAITLRVRGAFAIYIVGTMTSIGLPCRNCGALTLRSWPWVRCVDCSMWLMEVDYPTRPSIDMVANWVAGLARPEEFTAGVPSAAPLKRGLQRFWRTCQLVLAWNRAKKRRWLQQVSEVETFCSGPQEARERRGLLESHRSSRLTWWRRRWSRRCHHSQLRLPQSLKERLSLGVDPSLGRWKSKNKSGCQSLLLVGSHH